MRVGIGSLDASGLASLLGDILGADFNPATVPHIAAMRLLADAASLSDVDYGLAGQGRVIVHEAQTIRTPVPLVAGSLLTATGSFAAVSGDAAMLSLTLKDDSGVLVCALETRLRLGDLHALARPVASQAPAATPAAEGAQSAPITAAHVLRYAALSGDRNPIHLDAGLAASAGLPERVVHGMLLVALAEAALAGHWPGGRLAETRTRFVAPVFVGERVSWQIVERGRSPGGGRLARVSICTETGSIACIVDAVVEA